LDYDQGRDCYFLAPLHQKVYRPQTDGIYVPKYLAELLKLQENKIKPILVSEAKYNYKVKTLWVNPRTGGPVQESQITAIVKKTVQKYFAKHKNINPAVFRRLTPSHAFANNVRVEGENEDYFTNSLAYAMNTNPRNIELNYNRESARDRLEEVHFAVSEGILETDTSRKLKKVISQTQGRRIPPPEDTSHFIFPLDYELGTDEENEEESDEESEEEEEVIVVEDEEDQQEENEEEEEENEEEQENEKEEENEQENEKEEKEEQNEEEDYLVEKILNFSFSKKSGKLKFLIKWEGYPSSENSWISFKDLNCETKLGYFIEKLSKK
jgi:hypothetical protein